MATSLGLIPARGGSKGVLRKNVRSFCGKPLLAYAIASAKKSWKLDQLVVSTDDDAIAKVAKELDCEVIRRPDELAQDESPMVPVALHALETLNKSYDQLVLLQPTCPFRTPNDIDEALTKLEESGAPAVIGVYQVNDSHPARMYTMNQGRLEPLDKQWETANRQDLPQVLHRNGVIYSIRADVLKATHTFCPPGSVPHFIPEERSYNIDSEWDFLCAELLMAKHNENTKPRS